MEEDIKHLLERNLQATEKTLALVKKMHKAMIWGRIFHVIKWGILIAILIFVYIKVQPYLAQSIKILHDASESLKKVNSVFH